MKKEKYIKKINIIADDKIPFLNGVLDSYANVKYLAGSKTTAEVIKNFSSDALITRTRTKCDEKLLINSNVKFIGTATIGHDHIDKEFCLQNNIIWENAPGCNASSVAQYIASVIINIATEDNLDLRDLTLGIVGVGNVGSKIKKMAQNLGLKVILNDPPKELENSTNLKYNDLNYVLENSDIITIHTPLTYTNQSEHPTFHLADEKFFNKMKQTAYFINSGRGEVSNTIALKNALKNKLIKDAILDVWENEPNIDEELLKLTRYGTAHIAGYSLDGKANGTAQTINNIANFFNELPRELKTWYPDNIPVPEEIEISFDFAQTKLSKIEDFNKILCQIINLSYDINSDSSLLKANHSKFEKLRGNYQLRREFHCFKVEFINNKNIENKQLFTRLTTLLLSLNFSITTK
ncbi:4-phosphoerythronate dehydrogenase [Lentisphaerota bacterium WC36G]|nr:4-phosphoerythronate dehydrogenase [Lentisphaerae bacterium WC36]